jgi:hypothetical protein
MSHCNRKISKRIRTANAYVDRYINDLVRTLNHEIEIWPGCMGHINIEVEDATSRISDTVLSIRRIIQNRLYFRYKQRY